MEWQNLKTLTTLLYELHHFLQYPCKPVKTETTSSNINVFKQNLGKEAYLGVINRSISKIEKFERISDFFRFFPTNDILENLGTLFSIETHIFELRNFTETYFNLIKSVSQYLKESKSVNKLIRVKHIITRRLSPVRNSTLLPLQVTTVYCVIVSVLNIKFMLLFNMTVSFTGRMRDNLWTGCWTRMTLTLFLSDTRT